MKSIIFLIWVIIFSGHQWYLLIKVSKVLRKYGEFEKYQGKERGLFGRIMVKARNETTNDELRKKLDSLVLANRTIKMLLVISLILILFW